MRIDFAIIGAQKAATTYLHRCLAVHENVFIPRGEVSFFEDPDYGYCSDAELGGMFMDRGEVWVGVRRPNYLGREEVPARIARHCPNIKLICILRDPVSRAVSALYHQMSSGFLPVMDVEEGIEALLDGSMQLKYPRSRDILKFGLYHEHLSRYEQYFDRDAMYVVRQETLLSDDADGIGDVFAYLGLPPLGKDRRPGNSRQPGHYHQMSMRLKRLSIAISMRRNETNTRSHKRNKACLVAGRALEELSDILAVHVYKTPPPRLPKGLGCRLYRYYEEDLSLLERDWGITCPEWSARWEKGDLTMGDFPAVWAGQQAERSTADWCRRQPADSGVELARPKYKSGIV